MTEVIKIDLTPLENFQYNQISNHKFEFMLLTPDYRVVHSPFECKDYLQDIFYCEHNGRTSSIWGLRWKPGMYDVNADRFNMALSGGKVMLEKHAKPLQKFLNAFEEALDIEPTTVSNTDDPKFIVLNFSRDWTINGPMLSAYTTLIRIAGAYKKGDVMQYLLKLRDGDIKHPDYVEIEKERMIKGNLPKLAALMEGKRPERRWSDLDSIGMAHNEGITEFEGFPVSAVPEKKV
jgi:hypothetical protein